MNEWQKLDQFTVALHEATVWDDTAQQTWAISLSVANSGNLATGWAFMDPYYIELRFETTFTGEPPAFLSGVIPPMDVANNSLYELAGCSLELFQSLEKRLRRFLANGFFSITALQDTSSGFWTKRATRFNHGGHTLMLSKHKHVPESVLI